MRSSKWEGRERVSRSSNKSSEMQLHILAIGLEKPIIGVWLGLSDRPTRLCLSVFVLLAAKLVGNIEEQRRHSAFRKQLECAQECMSGYRRTVFRLWLLENSLPMLMLQNLSVKNLVE